MATDACEKYQIELYDDGERSRRCMLPSRRASAPPKTPSTSPVAPPATPMTAPWAWRSMIKDIGASVALYCETAVFAAADLQKMLEEVYLKYAERGKPVLFVTVGGEDIENCITALGRKDVPVFGDVYEAVACLGSLYWYQRYLAASF